MCTQYLYMRGWPMIFFWVVLRNALKSTGDLVRHIFPHVSYCFPSITNSTAHDICMIIEWKRVWAKSNDCRVLLITSLSVNFGLGTSHTLQLCTHCTIHRIWKKGSIQHITIFLIKLLQWYLGENTSLDRELSKCRSMEIVTIDARQCHGFPWLLHSNTTSWVSQ